jgi:putative flippase GtrA
MEPLRQERRRLPWRTAVGRIVDSPDRQMAFLQFALYLIVGGICFSIDIAGFVLLRHFELPILTASATSFVTSTITNYALCCAFVFRSGRFSRQEELLRLFAIAIVGLGLNSAVVWLLAENLGFDPTLAKILAVLPVLAWNYLGRRAIVFDRAPSAVLVMLSDRAREIMIVSAHPGRNKVRVVCGGPIPRGKGFR